MNIWKPIQENSHIYVSQNGQIWNRKKNKKLSLSLAQGYPSFSFQKKTLRVHRIVCSLFNGPPQEGQDQVRHIDGNKRNNHYLNLAWGDQMDNERDKDRHGNRHVGVQVKNSVLTDSIVREIRKLRSSGMKIREIAEFLGLKAGTVNAVTRGKNWRHVSCVLLILILSGCSYPRSVDSGCYWTQYMAAHPEDTPKTKKMLYAADLVRLEKCGDM